MGCRQGCKRTKNELYLFCSRLRLKFDDTRSETRFRLSAKRTSPLKSAGTSVQSTTGSRVARINGSNAGYTMFRGVKGTGYPLHLPISPSLPSPHCASPCAITFKLDSTHDSVLIRYSLCCCYITITDCTDRSAFVKQILYLLCN